jgi:MFS family permease
MPAIHRARVAVASIFFVNGVVLASWVPHIPAVKSRLGAGEAALGWALLAMAAGAVLALPLAGWLIGRFGSRVMTRSAAAAFCLAMPLPVFSPSLSVLALSLALLGALNGLLDVSMNTQAAALERAVGRPIMSSFHALFSTGGMVGALGASGAMAAGTGDTSHVITAAVLMLGVLAFVAPRLLPGRSEEERPGPAFVRPSRALVGLGILAFLGLLAEGAMADWSAVYLRETLGSSLAVAATGFAAFSLAMAVGRFMGDTLVSCLGARAVLRGSGGVAAAGLGGALLISHPRAGIIGCALVGLGIANIIPVLFSAATRADKTEPGTALAAVATIGYGGFLSGPPLIGITAEAAGLPVALGLVSAACVLVALLAGSVSGGRGEREERSEGQSDGVTDTRPAPSPAESV